MTLSPPNHRRTKSSQIAAQLRLQLSEGHFAKGQRYYSNVKLASEYGISVPTANTIIGNLCSDGLVRRQSGSGTYVTGKALNQSVVTYGILLWIDLHNPESYGNLAYELLANFERECANQGRKAKVFNLYDESCLTKLESQIAAGLDGVFMVPPEHQYSRMTQAVDILRDYAVAVTYWDSLHTGTFDDAIGIAFDDRQCVRTATEHLLSLGHQHIAFVGLSSKGLWERHRVEGYHEALTQAKVPKRHHIVEMAASSEIKPSDLIAMLSKLQKQGVTGIVATNDALARELILVGNAINIAFPDDMSIVGVDNLKDAHIMGLTTMDRPADALCRASLSALDHARLASDEEVATVALTCPLIIRETTDLPPNPYHQQLGE